MPGSGGQFVVYRFTVREITSDGVPVSRVNLSRRVAAPDAAVLCNVYEIVVEHETELLTGSVTGVVPRP